MKTPSLKRHKLDRYADTRSCRKAVVRGGALLLLLLFGMWLLWPESQLSRVRRLQQELAVADGLTEEEREEKRQELRAEEKKLTHRERDEFKKEKKKESERQKSAKDAAYFSMSPEQRQKIIEEKVAKELAKYRNEQRQDGAGQAKGQKGRDEAKKEKGQKPPDVDDQKERQKLLDSTPQARAGKDQMKLDLATARAKAGLPPEGKGKGK
jgi:hypothetical protein